MLHASEPVFYFPTSESSLNMCDSAPGPPLFLWVSYMKSGLPSHPTSVPHPHQCGITAPQLSAVFWQDSGTFLKHTA